jgi:DivIVA domain-containing protein
MAISFSRPDPSSPSAVSSATFSTARKGFEPAEVREFLRMVAAELARLQERERFLERELRTAQRSASPSSVALDDDLVTKMLGEEAARILQTAREAGSQIKVRAEDGAARLLRDANEEAQRLRQEAEPGHPAPTPPPCRAAFPTAARALPRGRSHSPCEPHHRGGVA